MSKAEVNEVVNLMSEQILQSLSGVAQEQYYPQRSSDESDAYMKAGIERATKLRKIREEYENLMTGVIL